MSVLNQYEGSVIKALTHVYPTIGLDALKFSDATSKLYKCLVSYF